MIEQQRQAYREEATELLDELEAALLALEESPLDREQVDRAFRSLHTIKGSGAMFGFDEISAFAHEIETAFDAVRDGRLDAAGELIGIGLAARDHLANLLAAEEELTEEIRHTGNELIDRLHRVTGTSAAKTNIGNGDPMPQVTEATYRIRFRPTARCFSNGTNPLPLLDELRALGTLSVVARIGEIPTLDALEPENCYVGWEMILTTAAGEDAIHDVFIFVEEDAELVVNALPGDPLQDEEQLRLGQLLVEREVLSEEELEAFLDSRPKLGRQLIDNQLSDGDEVAAVLMEQNHRRRQRPEETRTESAATVRVAANKLDALVNVVGEIVTLQARMSDYAQTAEDPAMASIAEEMERLSERLRDDTMSMRMLPVGTAFSRLRRLVRDLSSELGKKVDLVTEGEETELDKTVIERLGDPLVHLVRNCLDHGIELPAERMKAGKAERGTIRLSARHMGGAVVITVADDGAGLNRGAIRSRAEQAGLVEPGAILTDDQIDALILAPGFSTAQEVTEVSGRGVGMDVVKRIIDELRGSLEVASRPGEGTTFRLKLPLTLAIIDGLLVQVAGHHYVLPMANIVECIERSVAIDSPQGDNSLVTVRGELVGCLSLRDHFDLESDRPNIEHVVVAETRVGKVGLIVDHVVGDHQTVIKTLGSVYRDVEVVSGATILGDGRIALILDVEKVAADAIKTAA